jgi:hypothetical protein
MSSHRDFTPDEDQDELLLGATRPPDEGPSTAPPVTAIRLKVAQPSKTPSRKSSSSASSAAQRKHEGGDIDAELLNEGVPSPTAPSAVLSLGKSDQHLRPTSGPSRKRVLSNPTDPPVDDGTASGGRKRVKVAAGTGKKTKRTSKVQPAEPRPPSPSMYMEDGDDLLADELSLMDEEVAKRSTRGSSPGYRDLEMTPSYGFAGPSAEYNTARLASLSVPTVNEQDEPTRARQDPSSSPEITLLEGKTPQGVVVVPIPAPAGRTGVPLKRKKKSWLQSSKTVPIAIAPNPSGQPLATGSGATPEPVPGEKRKPPRKSRAIKSSAVVASSPQVEAMLDGEGYGLPPEMYLGPEAVMARGDVTMSVDGVSDVGSDVKPKKKKSKKLKPGEVGPGKHW